MQLVFQNGRHVGSYFQNGRQPENKSSDFDTIFLYITSSWWLTKTHAISFSKWPPCWRIFLASFWLAGCPRLGLMVTFLRKPFQHLVSYELIPVGSFWLAGCSCASPSSTWSHMIGRRPLLRSEAMITRKIFPKVWCTKRDCQLHVFSCRNIYQWSLCGSPRSPTLFPHSL